MGGEEAQNITDIKTRDWMCEMRCIRVKTIEKMLFWGPQISNFRLRRALRWLPEAATLIHLFGAPSGKSSHVWWWSVTCGDQDNKTTTNTTSVIIVDTYFIKNK